MNFYPYLFMNQFWSTVLLLSGFKARPLILNTGSTVKSPEFKINKINTSAQLTTLSTPQGKSLNQ